LPRERARQVTVLLAEEEYARFSAYCRRHGFKKSTLIARLIREYLEREEFGHQSELPLAAGQREE